MMNANIRTSITLSLGLILLAQGGFLPIPLSIIFVIMIGTVWWSLKKNKPVAKIWTLLITAAALGTIYFTHRSFIGVDAGVALLTTFLFAKALETKNKRDLIILFNFGLFVAASSFLYSQSFFMAITIVLTLLSCLLGLYRIQTSEFEQEREAQFTALKQDAKHVAKFVLYALPFFILLFIFFPRLPPLWHIPIPEKKGVTGISDTMSPGDIAELSQSSALAFRIIGDVQQLPPRSELYWRALVLDEYDGQRWTSHFSNQQPLYYSEVQIRQYQKGWDYQYLAADPSVMWVMGLEKSVPLERRYYNRQDWGIVPHRLSQRVEPISLRWVGQAIEQQSAQIEFIQRMNTSVQTKFDVKAQQLAHQLFEQSGQNPKQYIQRVLNWYRQNQFVYTLNPGLLGQNRIDDFLFESKQGFCEHYASSFVMLMRYVGIPARVVTGYQGGSLAPDAKSWEVRQLDAHAWTEVLINQQWERIDPTAIIAPQRIDDGMQNLIQQDSSIFGESRTWTAQQYAMMTKLRIWSDYASYQWQSKVVGYNADSQRNWLSKFGLNSTYSMVLVLILAIAFLGTLYFLNIYFQGKRKLSKVDRILDQFNRSLEKPLRREPNETFKQWMLRLAQYTDGVEPDILNRLIYMYEQSRYGGVSMNQQDLIKFKSLLKKYAYALKNKGKNLS